MSDACTIRIRVIPRAGRTEVAGKRGDAVLVRLAAAPVDGAANEALVAFVAGCLERPRRDVAIVAGERGRDKRVRVAGMPSAEIERRLLSAGS
jgi:uncharacterized protein (TIGR00251 family)